MLTTDDLLPGWIDDDTLSMYLSAAEGKQLALWSDGSTTVVDGSAQWAFGCGPLGLVACPGQGIQGDRASIKRSLIAALNESIIELEEIEQEEYCFDCEMLRFDADH